MFLLRYSSPCLIYSHASLAESSENHALPLTSPWRSCYRCARTALDWPVRTSQHFLYLQNNIARLSAFIARNSAYTVSISRSPPCHGFCRTLLFLEHLASSPRQHAVDATDRILHIDEKGLMKNSERDTHKKNAFQKRDNPIVCTAASPTHA